MYSLLFVLSFCLFVCPSLSIINPESNPLIARLLAGINTKSDCPAECNTQWLKMLGMFSSQVALQPDGALCEYANNNTLFTECQAPTDPAASKDCKIQQNIQFKCCPKPCWTAIEPCVGSTVQHLCIPSKLEPWRQDIVTMYVRSQQNNANTGAASTNTV